MRFPDPVIPHVKAPSVHCDKIAATAAGQTGPLGPHGQQTTTGRALVTKIMQTLCGSSAAKNNPTFFLPAVIVKMQRFFYSLFYLVHRELVQICGFIQQKSTRVYPPRTKTSFRPSRPGQISTLYVDNGNRTLHLADHFGNGIIDGTGTAIKERWPSGYIARPPPWRRT